MQERKKLIIIAFFILTFVIINLIMAKPVQAVTQIRSTDIDNINDSKYPGIKQRIKDLQAQHPNWNFKILYTGLDWNEVISNESVGHGSSPRNLIPVGSSYSGEWICQSCTADKYYDNGSWRCASTIALQYMMDPRNSMNDTDLFQYIELTYQECSYDSIKTMVKGTFLDNDSYINTIISAGRNHNVSPYYIVALAIQEQGRGGSSTVSGRYSGYEGYYNIFNINASGNGSGTIITRALTYAKNNGWDTLEKSIDGGVKKISTSYIAKGQDTLYLQKFDVDNSDNNLYWHQYQQNLMAARNEGKTIRKTFVEINSLESAYTFVIPVYENMPQSASKEPLKIVGVDTSNAEQVRVNVGKSLNFRATPGGEVIGALYKDEIVYRLEKATTKQNGTYWDKVMKANGTIGYAARETYDHEEQYKMYLIPVENGSNNSTTDKVKVETENSQITIVPETTVQEIIDALGDETSIVDKDGNQLGKTSIPGTGCVINGTHTVVMLGDVNGDAKINSGDLFNVQKHLIQGTSLEKNIKEAMDTNKDGKINSGDLFAMQKHLLGKGNITIN